MNGTTAAYFASGRSAHQVGSDGRSLCGAHPRAGRRWLGDGNERQAARLASLPACRSCAVHARVAAALATGSPGRRPGVIAMVAYHGNLVPVAECARCGRERPVPARGLCIGCYRVTWGNGTLEDYGWTRADRLAEYAGLRAGGLSVGEAAGRAGVTERTGWRYERTLHAEVTAA